MGKHFVPKFYLRGFARSDRLAVFDKTIPRWFYSQPKSVANEIDLWPDELETFVTENIEDPAKEVIERLRNKARVSDDERLRLARYIAFLWKRVPAGRNRVRDYTPAVADQVRDELNVALDELIREDATLIGKVELRRTEIAAYIEKVKIERPTWLWHGSLTAESDFDVGLALAGMNWMVLHM